MRSVLFECDFSNSEKAGALLEKLMSVGSNKKQSVTLEKFFCNDLTSGWDNKIILFNFNFYLKD